MTYSRECEGTLGGYPSEERLLTHVIVISRSRPFPFLMRVRRERVWPTAIELPVLAFTQGRVCVNWFEISRQPGPFDRQVLMRFIICLAASLL